MAMQEVKKQRIFKAKEQIEAINKKLVEHAKKSQPVFEYSYRGQLYSGVKEYFEAEGWHVEERVINNDGTPNTYFVEFTIAKGKDINLADLKEKR